MNKIQLFTKNDEFVTEVFYPSFEEKCYPDIVLWSERFFQKVTEEKYVECLAIVVFTSSEWKNFLGFKT